MAAEDLRAIEQNYQDLHEAGESWESITARVESVGDKRLAAFLRERAAGESGDDASEAPKERRAGNKAVTASAEDTAAETAADTAAAGEQAADTAAAEDAAAE